MATSGPGALNLVTGLADAKMDSLPIVAITGQVPTHVIGTDAFQETPMVEVCRAITKHHYLVQNARDIARIVKEAFHIASTGRPGPVLIDMPKDVQNTLVADPDYDVRDGPARLPPAAARRRPRRSARSLAAIKASQQADHLLRRRRHRLERRRGAPRVRHQDGHPRRHDRAGPGLDPQRPLPVARACSACTARSTPTTPINDADLLLALGVRFDDRVTGKLSEFAKHGRIVHVDIDASEINKNKAAHIADQHRRQVVPAGDQPAGRARATGATGTSRSTPGAPATR